MNSIRSIVRTVLRESTATNPSYNQILEYCELEDVDGKFADYHTNVNWSAENKKEYERIESKINDIDYKTEKLRVYGWFDVSGYDYWVNKQEEPNYLMLTVEFFNTDLSWEEVEDLHLTLTDIEGKFLKYSIYH